MARPAHADPSPAALARMETREALDHLTERSLALGTAGLRRAHRSMKKKALAAAIVFHIAVFGAVRGAQALAATNVHGRAGTVVECFFLPPPADRLVVLRHGGFSRDTVEVTASDVIPSTR